MKIVLDTNILISTLMSSDGIIGTFLLTQLREIEKFSCYYLYVEVFDKKEKIIKYSGLEEREILELLYLILKKIQFINEHQISAPSWRKAKELTEDIDVKDISFVALAIELEAKLFTGDKKLYKGLREKGYLDVVDFIDLKEIMEKRRD
jgi:putative PIN family toxin of toxin-antitoxin system